MREETQPSSSDVKRGVALGFAMHAIFATLWLAWWVLALKAETPPEVNRLGFFLWASIFYLGVTQAIYILPAIAWHWRKQQPLVVRGLIIAALLTLVINTFGLIVLFFKLGI